MLIVSSDKFSVKFDWKTEVVPCPEHKEIEIELAHMEVMKMEVTREGFIWTGACVFVAVNSNAEITPFLEIAGTDNEV
jgi:hypothetical protein